MNDGKALNRIIRTQLDSEILSKRYEIRAIQQELHRTHRLLTLLKSHILSDCKPLSYRYFESPAELIESQVTIDDEFSALAPSDAFPVNEIATRVKDTLLPTMTTPTATTPTVATPTATTPKVEETQHKRALIIRRDDGSFVRLSCPVCKRKLFANMQGFINHCLRLHNLAFKSHLDAISECGVVVDESKVPKNHPVRRMDYREDLVVTSNAFLTTDIPTADVKTSLVDRDEGDTSFDK